MGVIQLGLAAMMALVPPDATVVVSGTFWSGRGPCELLPDGTRRWALLQGFTVRKVHRGTVHSPAIGVQSDVVHLAAGAPLVEGREYVLFLRPSEESLKALRRRGGARRSRDALGAEEVLAIVERGALENRE